MLPTLEEAVGHPVVGPRPNEVGEIGEVRIEPLALVGRRRGVHRREELDARAVSRGDSIGREHFERVERAALDDHDDPVYTTEPVIPDEHRIAGQVVHVPVDVGAEQLRAPAVGTPLAEHQIDVVMGSEVRNRSVRIVGDDFAGLDRYAEFARERAGMALELDVFGFLLGGRARQRELFGHLLETDYLHSPVAVLVPTVLLAFVAFTASIVAVTVVVRPARGVRTGRTVRTVRVGVRTVVVVPIDLGLGFPCWCRRRYPRRTAGFRRFVRERRRRPASGYVGEACRPRDEAGPVRAPRSWHCRRGSTRAVRPRSRATRGSDRARSP